MSVHEPQDGIFYSEISTLQSAKSELKNRRYLQEELLDKYKALIEDYEKLLRITIKAIKISDSQWKELKRREHEIRSLLDNSNQGFLTFDRDLIVNKEYSSECHRLFEDKIGGKNILDLICSESEEQKELFSSALEAVFSEGDNSIRLEHLSNLPTMLIIKGRCVNINYKLINNEELKDSNCVIMLILTDITEKKRAEDQVYYLSYHDKLTALFNRTYIDSVIPQLQTSAYMPLSVIMADMNGLKLTNDVFGHQTGDKLLVNAAKVLKDSCRSTDIIARWGGDEYLIILPNTNQSTCRNVCNRIKSLCDSMTPDPLDLSISLGVATTESPNTSISELFNLAEDIMYRNKILEGKKIRRKIVLSVEKTLHKRCYEDYGHNERVKNMTVKFANLLSIEQGSTEMVNLELLASLHDIGKVSIPKEILGKQKSLTESELEIVRRYTEIGFRMAQSIEEPILAQSILCMRERWDGKGYPYGLKGENIPLHSRIIAIIESYDIMTHDRPYRKAVCQDKALQELRRCSGKQFDSRLVNIFVENFKSLI